MDAVLRADAAVFLWLNQWVGHFPAWDAVLEVFISDYFAPSALSLCLLGMWFAGRDARERDRYQRATIRAMIALGLASLAVLIINQHFFRARPFIDHEVTLLFYRPTDSSFPANPAAVAFAMASGIWEGNARVGLLFAIFATVWSVGRVYAGVFYPLDILGGAAIGITISYLVGRALRLIEPLPTIVLRVAGMLHLA
jgi:undecaprenyl-diphosphatase